MAMQIASASPVAIDESGVPQATKDEELKVAIEKTRLEQVQKAVEAALKKLVSTSTSPRMKSTSKKV